MSAKNKISIRSLITNQKGLALVEFSLMAPFLFILFFGVIELSRYIIIKQKLERTAYALSTMVSQYIPAKEPVVDPFNKISVDNMKNNVFPHIQKMMAPYNNPDDINAIVTSLYTNNPDAIKVMFIQWQIAGGGKLDNAGTKSIVNNIAPSAITPAVRDKGATFPAEIKGYLQTMTKPENMIVAEIFYNYQPLVSDILTRFGAPSFAQETMVSRVFFMPRKGRLMDLPDDFPVR